MKFIVDECVGNSVAQWLQESNYDTLSICPEFQGLHDEEILQKAYQENRILVTSDKDFGDMIFRSQRPHCGILLLRLINEHPINKIRVLEQILKHHAHELENNFVVATEATVRITKLPIFIN